MKQRTLTACLAAAGMMILILDGATALSGAAAGIELCLRTVIPSLFPFLFLCAMLTGALWGGTCAWMHSVSCRLGIPRGAESLLIAAVLGGYPAGAQMIGDAFRDQRISRQDANHLLTFCSNAGPAFLFGITALQFSGMSRIWALWIIQILSALFTGCIGASRQQTPASLPGYHQSLSKILNRTVRTMAILCGWILLFQIFLAFVDRWFFWNFPATVQVILTGLLELSSGCCTLSAIADPDIRFLVCAGLLSFGGLCVTLQTSSLIAGLSLSHYLRGKLIQTAVSLLLGAMYLRFGWGMLWAVLLLIPLPVKKRGGFLQHAGV